MTFVCGHNTWRWCRFRSGDYISCLVNDMEIGLDGGLRSVSQSRVLLGGLGIVLCIRLHISSSYGDGGCFHRHHQRAFGWFARLEFSSDLGCSSCCDECSIGQARTRKFVLGGRGLSLSKFDIGCRHLCVSKIVAYVTVWLLYRFRVGVSVRRGVICAGVGLRIGPGRGTSSRDFICNRGMLGAGS